MGTATGAARAAILAALMLALGAAATGCSHAASGGKERDFFIAADEVAWDYAPAGTDLVVGVPFGDQQNTYVGPGPDRIGSIYKKSLYREYTDATFTTLESRAADRTHLGASGPVIHAEVGDTIKVVFRNNTSRPASMHPHGVFYAKDSEGAPYADGTGGSDKADDTVGPGEIHTYVWNVPERAGPGPSDPSSIMWMYHSHTDEVADTYAGLIGHIVITRKGMAPPDGTPRTSTASW